MINEPQQVTDVGLTHWPPCCAHPLGPSTNCHWDHGGSLLEAVAKFDYVTHRLVSVWLGFVSHTEWMQSSGLV